MNPFHLNQGTPMKLHSFLCVILGLLLLCSGCASTRAPEGYAADTTPSHDGELWIGGANNPDLPSGKEIELHATGDDRAVPMIGGAVSEPKPTAPNRSAVQVQVSPEGARAGFDLLGIRNYRPAQWARDAWGPLKILSYPADYAGYMITEHPFQSLAIGLAAWELTDSGVSDTLGSLFGNDSSSSSSTDSRSTANTPQNESSQSGNVTITGDNNVVSFTTNSSSLAEAPRESNTTNNLER